MTLFPCDLIEEYEYECPELIIFTSSLTLSVFPKSLGLTLGLAPHSRGKILTSMVQEIDASSSHSDRIHIYADESAKLSRDTFARYTLTIVF